MAVLAVVVLAGSYLLMSPPEGQRYPGAIPWSDGSWLKRIVDALSLFGWFHTARGVEIKSLVFEFAVAVGLVLAAVRLWLGEPAGLRRSWLRGWPVGVVALGLWVLLSAASALWSTDPPSALTQAALYGFGVAWALCLGLTLRAADARRVLIALAGVGAVAAGLCIAYYRIRNPYHRPGFPLGNPSLLGAAMLPPLAIAFSAVVASLGRLWRGDGAAVGRVAAAAVLWVVVAACFLLADSRAAYVGVFVAAAALLLTRSPGRWRVGVAIALLVTASAAGWYLWSSREAIVMARGPTIRFRLYAWKYAAQLWWRRPVSGIGAGAFVRVAGALSARDRMLDPAAFMAELVEHAHNELFEVLTEIGLVGGAVFLAGWLAVLTTALQSTGRDQAAHRGLRLALAAAIVALMADAMFGVSLRLPGVPAVFYTLIGVLWTLSRGDETPTSPMVASPPRANPRAALGLLLLALVFTALAGMDLRGVRAEYAAVRALQVGDDTKARDQSQLAARWLLDPVRRLISRERAVRARYDAARKALSEYLRRRPITPQPASAPAEVEALRQRAIRLAQQAYRAAAVLSVDAPALGYLAAYGARLAEQLAELYRDIDPQLAERWMLRAFENWRVHRQLRPFDPQALLALTRYPLLPADHLGLLRDALRAGLPSAAWKTALRQLERRPDFDRLVNEILATVGPYGPQTDADTLMLVRVPETLRLGAWAQADRGRFDQALQLALRASALYRVLAARLPAMRAVALTEAGEFALLADPKHPQRSIDLLHQALDALPPIQPQKRDELARPVLRRLARALLLAGRPAQAIEQLRRAGAGEALEPVLAEVYVRLAGDLLRVPAPRRPDPRPLIQAAIELVPDNPQAWAVLCWIAAEDNSPHELRKTLQQAAAAGLGDTQLRQIVQQLCQRFPAFCARLGPSTRTAPATPDRPAGATQGVP